MNLNEKIFSLYENILSKKSLILEQSQFVQSVPTIPGIDEMVWNKAPYGYDRGNLQMGVKWPGHNTHIHFGFTTPDTAIAIIKKTLELGLRAAENPYSDDVQPVHTGDSFHYEKFDGKYDGKTLGKGLDVSGDREKMIQLFNWVVTDIGGGQPIPLVTPDDGTSTTSPLDFLENLPDNAVETLKNVGVGAGVAAGAYGAYKLATANKGDKSTSPSSSTTPSSTDLGIHSKFVYGGKKESPFLSENLKEQSENEESEEFGPPLRGELNVNSKFGPRWGRLHTGIDLRATSGSHIISPLPGTVVDVDEVWPCGGRIRIVHPGDFRSGFCHVKEFRVSVGDTVEKGQVIGLTGGAYNDPMKGRSDGPHLHYTLYKKINGKYELVNPEDYLGGQEVPLSEPDTESEMDTEMLKNIGVGAAGVAGAYGTYKLATANKGNTNTPSSTTPSSTDLGIHSKFVYGGKKESPFLSENLNEQTISGSFGRDVVRSGSSIMIPKGTNSQANSPVSGRVDNNKRSSFFACKNKTDIYFEDGKFFLRYCGLDNTISNGVSVNLGSRIGDVNQNVMVYLYDKNGSSKSLSNYVKNEPQKAPETYQSRQKSNVLSKQYQSTSINSKPTRKDVTALSQKRGEASIKSRNYSKVDLMKEVAENISKIKKLL